MKTTCVTYVDEFGNLIATLSRCRNVPVKGDTVVLHTTQNDKAVNASYEVERREWVADGSACDVTLTRITPFRLTDTDEE